MFLKKKSTRFAAAILLFKTTVSMKALLYVLAIALGLSAWTRQIVDPDLGWHLLGGEWIVTHKQVPSADFINTFNHTWRDYHWLAQIVLYKVYTLGGFPLLRILHALISMSLLLTVVSVLMRVTRHKPASIVSILTVVFSWSILFRVSSPRPQIMALLLIALSLRELLKKPSSQELFKIGLLTILLVNIHVYWCFIPVLWMCYRLLPALLRGKPDFGYALLGFILLLALGMVSPYGYQNYLLLWEYLWMPNELSKLIAEFQPSLTRGGNLLVAIPLYAIFMILAFKPQRYLIHIGDWLCALLTLGLAIHSVKYAGLLAVLGIPLLSRNLGALLRRRIKIGASREKVATLGIFALLLLPTVILLIVFFPLISSHRDEPALYASFPLRACHALSQHNFETKTRNHIRVLTHFDHGGWCRWALQQARPDIDFRVTTDGRTQDAEVQNILISFALYAGKVTASTVLNEWRPDAIVVKRGSPFELEFFASLKTDWKSIYEDASFRVLIPGNI